MTEHEIRLIEDSWAAVAPISGDAAALFYERLFEIDPRVRSLFKGDMEQQGKKLMQMIGVAVAHLGRTEEIAPAVRALGQRHAGLRRPVEGLRYGRNRSPVDSRERARRRLHSGSARRLVETVHLCRRHNESRPDRRSVSVSSVRAEGSRAPT